MVAAAGQRGPQSTSAGIGPVSAGDTNGHPFQNPLHYTNSDWGRDLGGGLGNLDVGVSDTVSYSWATSHPSTSSLCYHLPFCY